MEPVCTWQDMIVLPVIVNEWRVEKRSLSAGTLITSFGTGGVITSEPSSGTNEINAAAIDATGLYVAGVDNVGGTGGECRIEKRDLSTGSLITFGSGGVAISNPSFSFCLFLAL